MAAESNDKTGLFLATHDKNNPPIQRTSLVLAMPSSSSDVSNEVIAPLLFARFHP
jgi:hypothetical protein